MNARSTVINLKLHENSNLAACPFQPAVEQIFENKVYSIKFQCIKIRQDLNYFSLQANVGGQQPAFIRIPDNHVALAFVRTGWIKTKLYDQEIEKLEPGQWFYFACEKLCLDRSCEEGTHIEIFICSCALIDALLQLEGARAEDLTSKFCQRKNWQPI